MPNCAKCEAPAEQQCSRCKAVTYCGREHQVAHWKEHKGLCKLVTDLAKSGEPFLRKTTKAAPEGARVVASGDAVDVHYTGMLPSGSVFDSSLKRGRTFNVEVGGGRVIRGWDEGLVGASVGESFRIAITPDYGYGPYGHPPAIPGNSVLVFDIDVVSIADSDKK